VLGGGVVGQACGKTVDVVRADATLAVG